MENLPGSAGALADVEPVHLGWLHQAIRVWSGRYGEYVDSVHIPLPQPAAWVAIIVELIGGILILVGYQTRWVALALAIWCLVTALAVHLPVGDTPNMINFYKNLVMAGGFLFVASYGPGSISVDQATGMET